MSARRLDRWQPAHFLQKDVVLLTWLLLALAMVRGLDYSIGNDANRPPPGPGVAASPLIGIEAAFPLPIWGALILASVIVLAVGVVGRWHLLVYIGHAALGALYAGLFVGLVIGYFDRPYLDGIRSATGLALPVALHLLFLWRMGPRPVIPRSARAHTA